MSCVCVRICFWRQRPGRITSWQFKQMEDGRPILNCVGAYAYIQLADLLDKALGE
jgi:hypothetical protein